MQEKASTIIQAILIISSIFILVAAFVVSYLLYFNKRKARLIAEKDILKEEFQQQLLQSQVEVQEATYSALAKELHDNVGQLLSTAKMLLGLAERELKTPPDAMTTANATVGKAIQEIRALAKSLDKEWLEQFSFSNNLTSEIDRMNVGDIITAKCLQPDHISLKADEQIILFRIVQEAIQNAIKHSKPKNIDIRVVENEHELFISIKDDGHGLNPHIPVKGMGISNMKYRTKILGGVIDWDSSEENGTTVTIFIPIKEKML